MLEWRMGESTNCWSGGRESLLIVGVGDRRVLLIVGVGDGRVD